MAACLTACLTDPHEGGQGGPQSPPISQGVVGNPASGDSRSVAFRVALPESAIGRVDSAELRVHRPDGTGLALPLTVGDSILEADLAGLDPGPVRIEVFAFAAGSLAYYGSAPWDFSEAGSATVSVTLGRIGRVSIEGHFSEGPD